MDNARELSARLLDLLRREQSAMAEFLVALASFDRKRLWAELGHTSLFYFLRRELRLSAGAAFYRKAAVELIQRFPDLVEPLRDGRLCLSSVAELAKVLTPENRAEVLPRFFHASKQEAKAVAAEISPRQGAPHRMVVTAVAPVARARQADGASVRLPAGDTAALTTCASAELAQDQNPFRPDEAPAAAGSVAAPMPPIVPAAQLPSIVPAAQLPSIVSPAQLQAIVPPAPPRSTIEPLTADLRRLHITVSKRFMAKLEAARDALSHSLPRADAEAILEAGLDLLIERAAKRMGICARPEPRTKPKACTRPMAEKAAPPARLDGDGRGRSEQPRRQARISQEISANAREGGDSPDGERAASRHVPAHVKREVWLRDDGKCQFKLENGELCGSTHRLQFDHIRPVALGGESTVSNIRLACGPHNLLEARRVFGDALMDRYAPARTPGAPLESW